MLLVLGVRRFKKALCTKGVVWHRLWYAENSSWLNREAGESQSFCYQLEGISRWRRSRWSVFWTRHLHYTAQEYVPCLHPAQICERGDRTIKVDLAVMSWACYPINEWHWNWDLLPLSAIGKMTPTIVIQPKQCIY
jgi:hypothetical protein